METSLTDKLPVLTQWVEPSYQRSDDYLTIQVHLDVRHEVRVPKIDIVSCNQPEHVLKWAERDARVGVFNQMYEPILDALENCKSSSDPLQAVSNLLSSLRRVQVSWQDSNANYQKWIGSGILGIADTTTEKE